MFHRIFIWAATCGLFICCSAQPNSFIGIAAGDSDTDSDGDTDTGTSAGDTDSDGDTDTGTSAGDMDSDGDTDTGTSAGDTDSDGDTDTGTSAGDTDSDGDTDTGTSAGDTDSNGDTDTGTSAGDCPWICKPNIDYFSCDKFDWPEEKPELIHNWNYDCSSGEICCQPLDAAGGITDYCGDFNDSECNDNICTTKQIFDRYCNGGTYSCCAK